MKSSLRTLRKKVSQQKRTLQFPYAKYNKKNSCIFIHIPKVAGTSITDALADGKAQRNHLPWYVYYTANKTFFEQAFKFSFVRNPWDRALSAYNYLVSGGNKSTDLRVSEMVSKYSDFDDFVINGLGGGWFRNHLLFIPQSEFIVNGEQEIVVDFLGRFENIDEDFGEVLNSIGVDRKLDNKNSSKRSKDYKPYYKRTRSIEVISEIYAQDVKMFSYEY